MAHIGHSLNLEELRGQLSHRLAWVLATTGGLAVWVLLYLHYPLSPLGVLLAGLMTLGWGVGRWAYTRPVFARHLLTWGLVSGLLVSMGVSAEPWLPFLGLLLIFVNTVLLPIGGVATAGAVAALATWLTHSGARVYPLVGLLTALTLAVVVAWLIVHTLYTALEWAWTMQQRADHLLEVARDHQAELNKALKSLDTANYILRRTQRELIMAWKQADDARQAKEQFAAHVSHELRTPLNIIIGFSEMIHLSPEVYGLKKWPAALRQDIYQIYESARHLLQMINDVLDLSRFELAGFALHKESVAVQPLLQETMGIVAGLARGRPIQLQLDCQDGLPTLEIDRIRIRQVLLNLLNNALRFTEQGEVRLAARQVGNEILFSVSDTGPGIAAADLPNLFREFYQADLSLNRRHGGTGLGLAISKHFVEAHNGRIWVESEPGAGATFYFTIPITGKSTPLARLKDGRPLEIQERTEKPLLLIVDRDPGVAELAARRLQNYEVLPVEDSPRLREAIALYHPQAVIYNVRPGEHADRAALDGLPVPIIECSLPSRAWIEERLHVSACLTKPVTAAQLLEQMERFPDARDVLVIDDDRGFCLLVERILACSGRPLSVRRAYSGQEGLDGLRQRRPDLVLLDTAMPDMSGFEVLERLRQEEGLSDLPVILITAASLAEDFLAQQETEIVIRRPDRLRVEEVLECLQAVLSVLRPRYGGRTVLPGA